MNYRTANYRTLNCFRTLHLHSRTLNRTIGIVLYQIQVNRGRSQLTHSTDKMRGYRPMTDFVLCQYDFSKLTDPFGQKTNHADMNSKIRYARNGIIEKHTRKTEVSEKM